MAVTRYDNNPKSRLAVTDDFRLRLTDGGHLATGDPGDPNSTDVTLYFPRAA